MDDPHDDDTPDDSPEARFSAELRRLRLQAGLSLRELADRLHRAHSTISEFESGRRLPGFDVIEQYEDYFGLPRGTLGAQLRRARARARGGGWSAVDDPSGGATAGDTPEARFGALLRDVRVRAGVSVRRLAKDLDRAHSTISDFETGRRLPGVEVVEQYEDRFGLSRGTLGAPRERARAERLEDPKDATVEENLGDVACPYKGLRPFESEDAALFFGREVEVQQVLRWLAQARFVAVIGASGSGKSSFMRAGVLAHPDATRGGDGANWRVVLLSPGERPVDALANAVTAVTGAAGRVLAEELRNDPQALPRAVSRSGSSPVVIAVDQFEDLFTQCRDEAERRCFSRALIAAWRDPARQVAVILTLRADFYGQIAAYPELAAAVVAHQTLIGPMSSPDLRRTIELPATKTGLRLQPGLTETILEDLADEPGALPLLSHALLETWKRRRRLMLTVAGYREAGGVRGAIAQTAEHTLRSLPESDQAIARSILLSLTDVGESTEPTGRRLDRAELAVGVESTQRDRVLGVLADGRLVTLDERTITVAHEALIRHWPRLRSWIEADRAGLLTHRQLTDAAREWNKLKREPGALYRGARLATASEWATGHRDQLSQLEGDFIAASQAAQQRRTRRLRALATGLAAVTVIVAALAVWALDQRNNAQRRGTVALQQTKEAMSLALTATASQLLDSRPDVSLLLALEANRARPRAEARNSALRALIAVRDPGVVAILHTDAVHSVAFGPDGRTLASASADNTIRLWDMRNHKQLGKPMTGSGSIAFGHEGRTLASINTEKISRWDVRTHRRVGQLMTEPITGRAFTVELSPDGQTLASVGYGNTIQLWDVRTRKQLGKPLTGYTHEAFSVTFSPDGRTLASAGYAGSIRLWDVGTRKQLGKPLTGGHTGAVLSVAFSPNGRKLASVGYDAIRLWDLRTHTQLGKLTGHTGPVNSVTFSPDGRTLGSAGNDKTVRLWDVRTRKQLGKLTGHTDQVYDVAFSPDRRTLASTSADSTIRLWDVHKRAVKPLTGHNARVNSVTFSRDRHTLASASNDKTIRLWDVRTRKQRGKSLIGHSGPVTSVAFSPDGRTLASAGNDKTIRLWDGHDHKQRGKPLIGHGGEVFSVAFSPDGRTLASAGFDKTVRLWDVHQHKELGSPLRGHTSGVGSVAFSPDGRTLASASDDTTIRLWDVHQHKELGSPLRGHTDAVSDVAFSPDGRTLASASLDKTVRLWGVHTHKPLGVALRGHTEWVLSVAFSPDGRTLASSSNDKTIRLWDVRSNKPVGAPLRGHTNGVLSVAFSPDGRTLASASWDKTIRLWARILWRNFAELQTEVCELVGSGLSTTEWPQYVAGIPYHQSCP